ncbi:MAG: acyl-[acyl-carrier-protein]--UDP-N-acetylglucosamine O-acyltransferase [Euryarchaeota archaeon]|nr:acyl-[acyl-carrier-protein]--UDP-N-acetylglucosamine O-acyltransferase [Euryarchaeota archaeon]|tara:strand:- start:2650 stop:3435 length:786 start_codon:yes stop_codon:yes gene_type:complete
MPAQISPQAFVHESATIGDGVVIEPFAYIGPDVIVGDRTWVGPNANIVEKTTIGADCKIFPGAVVGAEPQDLKFADEPTEVVIGNRTVIRECVTIHRATVDRHKTVVGDDCLIMAYVHLAHDVHVGNHVVIANAVNIAGHCTIEDWVIIEGMVGVQQFVRIGAHSFIAGGSLVRKNVPPYIKAAREPLAFIGVNSIGLRRRGFLQDRIQRIEDIYRTLYVQNANMSQALKVADVEFPKCEEKDLVLDFIRESDKGIIRGPF